MSHGVFIALVCLTAPVFIMFYEWIGYYLLLLLFLGVGLKPLLLVTGLHALWQRLELALLLRWNRGYVEKRRAELERIKRSDKLRRSRVPDERLPPNW